MTVKPMKAWNKPIDFDKLRYPMMAQPKLDGIRCIIKDGVGLSNSLKPIPNQYVQKVINSCAEFWNGLDGELIIGPEFAPDVYNRTQSGIMSQSGEPSFNFHAFDCWDMPSHKFDARYQTVTERIVDGWANRFSARMHSKIVHTQMMCNQFDIEFFEDMHLRKGYEGIIMRGINEGYKYGRSTLNEQKLLKLKRFQDAEAVIQDFEELMHNENEAFTNELGYTAHSSHNANKRPGGVLGALVCNFVMPEGEEVEIRLGSGFDFSLRKQIWENKDEYVGKHVKFKYMPHGMKDKPRHPIFTGFRHGDDLSAAV